MKKSNVDVVKNIMERLVIQIEKMESSGERWGKYPASVKRASMDLTPALANLRMS